MKHHSKSSLTSAPRQPSSDGRMETVWFARKREKNRRKRELAKAAKKKQR